MAVSLDHLTLPLPAGQRGSPPIPSTLRKLKIKNSGIICISMLKHIGLDSPLKKAARSWVKITPLSQSAQISWAEKPQQTKLVVPVQRKTEHASRTRHTWRLEDASPLQSIELLHTFMQARRILSQDHESCTTLISTGNFSFIVFATFRLLCGCLPLLLPEYLQEVKDKQILQGQISAKGLTRLSWLLICFCHTKSAEKATSNGHEPQTRNTK